MFSIFDKLKEEVLFKKKITLNRFQGPYEKSFKKIKRLKSFQKAEVYLEPMRASTMELLCECT